MGCGVMQGTLRDAIRRAQKVIVEVQDRIDQCSLRLAAEPQATLKACQFRVSEPARRKPPSPGEFFTKPA